MKELQEYVTEIMQAKKLRAIDVEARSGGKITDSHISNIVNGKTTTMGADKINALAEGLGVDSWEVFQAVSGNSVVHSPEDPWPSYALVTAVETIVNDPDLTAIVKALLKMKPSKRKALRKQIEKAK